jgi:HTH-type transcriptional regulator/antitoxin HigA
MLSDEGQPVIGLTIRHDRIDNFWFTLLHELSHIAKHLRTTNETFIDNDIDKEPKVQIEKEADKLAREAFIPRNVWMQSNAHLQQTEETIKELANDQGIHYAIVAGRIRYETNSYHKFDELVGRGKVKKLFFPD